MSKCDLGYVVRGQSLAGASRDSVLWYCSCDYDLPGKVLTSLGLFAVVFSRQADVTVCFSQWQVLDFSS